MEVLRIEGFCLLSITAVGKKMRMWHVERDFVEAAAELESVHDRGGMDKRSKGTIALAGIIFLFSPLFFEELLFPPLSHQYLLLFLFFSRTYI